MGGPTKNFLTFTARLGFKSLDDTGHQQNPEPSNHTLVFSWMIDNLFLKPLLAYKNIFINFSVYTYNIVAGPGMTRHNIKLMTKLITKSWLTKLVEAQKPQSINKHNKTSAGGGRALICTLFCCSCCLTGGLASHGWDKLQSNNISGMEHYGGPPQAPN